MKKIVLSLSGLILSFLLVASHFHVFPGEVQPAGIIHIGSIRALGTVAPYVAKTLGIFSKYKIPIEVADFSDGSALMEAFASGRIDIAFLGIAPAAIWQERGVQLKIVASANGGGHVLLTRNDTGMVALQALKNRKVATPNPGTVVDTIFRSFIVKEVAGLDPERDIRIVPGVAPSDMPAALFAVREVDAGITWEPFASEAEVKFKNARVLFDVAAEWKKRNPQTAHFYPTNIIVARQSFINRRGSDLRNFLAAYVDVVSFLNSKPMDANQIIAQELKLAPYIVARARQRIDYTVIVDIPAALRTLEWSKQAGYLKKIPEQRKLFDLSYLPSSAQ